MEPAIFKNIPKDICDLVSLKIHKLYMRDLKKELEREIEVCISAYSGTICPNCIIRKYVCRNCETFGYHKKKIPLSVIYEQCPFLYKYRFIFI